MSYIHLSSGDAAEEEDAGLEEVEEGEDIDELLADSGRVPLLGRHQSTSDSDEDSAVGGDTLAEPDGGAPRRLSLASAQRGGGGFWRLLGGQRRKKGVCPLCFEVVRSGAHSCRRAEGALQAGLRSDAERQDGNAHFRAGRHLEAVQAYTAALRDAPHDHRLFSNRAAAHLGLRDFERAISDSDSAIVLAPSWPKAYFRKALVLEAHGDWAGAVVVYREALRRCGSIASGVERSKAVQRLAAARAKVLVEGLPAAFAAPLVRCRWQHLRDALAPAVDEDALRSRMAAASEQKAAGNEAVGRREWAAAGACYRRGLALLRCQPSEPSEEQARLEAALQLNCALCEAHLDRHAAAAELCSAALALDPANVKARFRHASALGELEEYDAALRETLVANALAPGDAEVRALRQRLRVKRHALRARQQAQCARMFGADSGRSSSRG